MESEDTFYGLEKSPRPLLWIAVISIALGGGYYFHSAFGWAIAGLSIGWYFGNYHGRHVVLNAWQEYLKEL